MPKLTSYRVVFQRHNGQYLTLGEVEEETPQLDLFGRYPKCNEIINQFLKDHNFISYYSNMYLTTFKFQRGKLNYPALRVDVGSHTEFFYIVQMNNWKNKNKTSSETLNRKEET